MATVFHGTDQLTKKKFTYIYGRLKEHKPLISLLDELIDKKNTPKTNEEVVKKWLTNDEWDMLSKKKLTGYEFALCPFRGDEGVTNLPFLRFVFESKENYIRKYDNLEPVLLYEHDNKNFQNPITGKKTVEIIRIDEVE